MNIQNSFILPKEITANTNNKRKTHSLTGRRERKKHKETRNHSVLLFKLFYKCALSHNIVHVTPYNLGDLTFKCEHCHSLHFECEKTTRGHFSLCCGNGKISLPESRLPNEIFDLFVGENDESKHFREHIRQYNSAMSFVSFGSHITLPSGYGPYCFKIHGDIYHRISSLYPSSGQNPSYGQLYILDFAEANKVRLNKSQNILLKSYILDKLHNVLSNINPYAKSYKQMHELTVHGGSSTTINMIMRFYHEPREDIRRYNDPTVSEIAAVFESSDGAPPSHRQISVYPKKGDIQRIDYDSMHCDPMTYVLIWPYGEPGWYINMQYNGKRKTAKRCNISMREYVCFRMAIKGIHKSMIHLYIYL